MADVPGKFFKATKVRTGVSPSSPGVIEGETLPPVNPPGGALNSVGLSMPSAFNVANSPLTSNGTLAVTGAGTVGQYIRGDGSLADFPQASGGGSSVSYYLNGSVNQGTIGGVAYRELSKVPILGAGTDFTINADGYIASFITDAGDPNLLEIPGGNWNFETYFSASSGGGSPTFYVELYKVSGTTATLIASSSSAPELIAFGTNLTPYFSSLAVPTTTLALTDRLAIRYYVTHSGRTITMHTENNHLCQIITTFTTGLTALNGLTAQVQNFAVGTTGTDFNIASAVATHTFNLPTASATNRGALSSADWSLFRQAYNDKINSASVTGTTTKTLTLVQQDGGEIQASWSDLNTDAVTSVFGRTGAVVAVSGDYNTSQVTESGNLYFTQARVSANTDVAANTAARHNAVTLGTANGLSLSTQQLSLGLASGSATGALSSTDWNTFNNKENAITAGTTAQYFRGDKTFQTLNTAAVPESGNLYFTNARAIASVLTGYTSGAGTISSADTILSAIQKLNGNIGGLVTGVSSVNGQTGAVTLTTTNIGEGTNLYFTNTRARAALSFAAGSGAYNTSTGVITIPTDNNQIANGANYITAAALSAYLPLAGGTMTGVITTPNGTFGIVIGDDSRLADRNVANTLFVEGNQNNDRGYINFSQTSGNALGAVNGGDLTWRGNVVLHAANFNSYAPTLGGTGATGTWSIAITGNAGTVTNGVVTTGSYSNPSWITALSWTKITDRPTTLAGYGITDAVPSNRTITINGTTQDLSANRTFNVGTVTSVTATSPLFSSGGATPNITIQQASNSQSGFLSSTDWTTFNNKQNALTNPVTGTGTTNYLPKFTGTSTIGNSIISESGTIITVAGSSRFTGFDSGYYNENVLAIGNVTNNPKIGLASTSGYRWNTRIKDVGGNGEYVIRYEEGSLDALIINRSGNLGLGVTPSAWAFFKAVQVNGGNSFVGYNNQAEIWSNSFYDGASKYYANGFATRYAAIDGRFEWYQAPSGTAGNAISFTQAMTLTSNSRLLVGFTSEQSTDRLQISGNIRASGYIYANDGTREVYLNPFADFGAGAFPTIQVSTNHALQFATNNQLRATITSTGNVLIGTTTDNGARLQVSGAVTAGVQSGYSYYANHTSAYSFLFSQINGGNTIAFDNSGGNLQLYTGGGLRATLNTSGNLGLGVTPSAWGSGTGFQVSSWASLSSSNAYGTGLGFNTFYNGTNHIYSFSNFASMLQQSGGQFRFYTAAAGTAGNAISFTQAMTLFATGNLLVGTPSPISDNGARLQVSGTSTFSDLLTISANSGANALKINGRSSDNTGTIDFFQNNGSTRVMEIGVSPSAAEFYYDANSPMIFYTNGSPRLTIANSGAATFSSSVTAGGLLSTQYASAGSTMGAFIVNTAASTINNSADIYFGTWGGSTIAGITNARISALNVNAGNAATDLLFYTWNGSSSGERFRIASTGAATFSSSVTSNGFIIGADQQFKWNGYNSATAYITSNAGFNSDYNGVGIFSNPTNANSLPAWAVDLGGLDGPTIGGVADGFTISRKASGGSWASRFVINSTGNVGIGTTSPAAVLHVAKSDGVNDVGVVIQQTANNTAAFLRIAANNDGGAAYNVITSNTNGGTEHWRISGEGSNNTFAIRTGGTERMRITSGGNVLIGLAGNNGGILRAKDITNRYAIAFEKWNSSLTLGGFFQNSGSSGEMILVDTNGSQNVLISSSGNSYWNAPSARFSIGTSVNTTDLFRVAGNTFTNTIMTWNPENDNRSGVEWRLGAASIGSITPNRRLRVNVGGVEYFIGAVEV